MSALTVQEFQKTQNSSYILHSDKADTISRMKALQSDQNSDQVLKSKDDAFPNAISGHNFVRKVKKNFFVR